MRYTTTNIQVLLYLFYISAVLTKYQCSLSSNSLGLSVCSDVFCGSLLCSNIGRNPRIGMMKGDITPTSFNHQGRLVDCR